MALEEAGTELDPYLLETVSDLSEIPTYDLSDGSKFFKLVNDIAVDGQLPRFDFYGDLDLNGFSISNVTSFQFGNLFNGLDGRIHDGEINVNVTTNDGGDEAIIFDLNGSGVCERVRFTGTITASGTGNARVFNSLKGNGLRDCVFDITLTTVDGIASPVTSATAVRAYKCVSIGTYTATGSGAAYGFMPNTATLLDAINCFYDNEINTGLGADKAFPKTTAELRDIRTYTDDTFNTDLVTSEIFDMVALGSYVDEDWAIDDGVAYPVLGFQVEPSIIPSVTFTDEAGTAISGALVRFFTVDAFDSKSPAFTNFTLVGSAYTTDVNGVATYDPNTDPAVDGTKVYGAIAFDAEAGSTEMEVSTGISFGRQNVDVTLP